MHHLRWTLLGLFTLGLLLPTAWLYQAVHARPDGVGEVRVEVPKGTTGRQLVRRLGVAGLAPHPRVTYWLMRYEETFAAVQAGIHVLPANASIHELASLLKRPAALPEISLTLIPGETIWHVAKRLEAAGLSDGQRFLRLAADRKHAVALGLPVGPERPPRPDGVPQTYLEGFLTPETHFFSPDTPLEAVLATVTEAFKAMWTPLSARRKSDLTVLRDQLGLTVADVLVLASLVERETRIAAEAPTIAGVFVNRLKRGMRLQTDPTLIYHPERVGLVPTPSHRRDATNPYNTYAHDGLPPGPICSPTRQAIEATLAPARHDFLYFCAYQDGTGRHAFARTLEEHQANIRRYLRGP
jgi:UPF0755 protein